MMCGLQILKIKLETLFKTLQWKCCNFFSWHLSLKFITFIIQNKQKLCEVFFSIYSNKNTLFLLHQLIWMLNVSVIWCSCWLYFRINIRHFRLQIERNVTFANEYQMYEHTHFRCLWWIRKIYCISDWICYC
jgi:hypothetical protein